MIKRIFKIFILFFIVIFSLLLYNSLEYYYNSNSDIE